MLRHEKIIDPLAVDDIFYYAGMSGTVNIFATENDTDADGGDLRIAQLANEPPGTASIRFNRIEYTPLANASGLDTILYLLVDTQGGIDTGMVVVDYDTIISTDEIQAESEAIQVYPNPVKELATIEVNNVTVIDAVHLFDSMGKQVACDDYLSASHNKATLDTGFLSAGVYLISVRVGDQVFSKKLIVSK